MQNSMNHEILSTFAKNHEISIRSQPVIPDMSSHFQRFGGADARFLEPLPRGEAAHDAYSSRYRAEFEILDGESVPPERELYSSNFDRHDRKPASRSSTCSSLCTDYRTWLAIFILTLLAALGFVVHIHESNLHAKAMQAQKAIESELVTPDDVNFSFSPSSAPATVPPSQSSKPTQTNKPTSKPTSKPIALARPTLPAASTAPSFTETSSNPFVVNPPCIFSFIPDQGWSKCSQQCDYGMQTQHQLLDERDVKFDSESARLEWRAECHAQHAPKMVRQRPCNVFPCPQHVHQISTPNNFCFAFHAPGEEEFHLLLSANSHFTDPARTVDVYFGHIHEYGQQHKRLLNVAVLLQRHLHSQHYVRARTRSIGDFWACASSKHNRITVGAGTVPGNHILLAVELSQGDFAAPEPDSLNYGPPTPVPQQGAGQKYQPIQFVALQSSSHDHLVPFEREQVVPVSAHADDWEFLAYVENPPDHRIFDDFLLADVNHEVTLHFQVRTAGAATIAFMTCAAQCPHARAAWEIVIGDAHSHNSTIRYSGPNEPAVPVQLGPLGSVTLAGEVEYTSLRSGMLDPNEYRWFWINIVEDGEFMPTDTQFRRFMMSVGEGAERGEPFMQCPIKDLQQGLLAVAFGALGAPAAFKGVRLSPHGDPRTVDKPILLRWFGMDWAQHVMARFDAAHAKDSSEDGKSRERDDAMDRNWWRSVEDLQKEEAMVRKERDSEKQEVANAISGELKLERTKQAHPTINVKPLQRVRRRKLDKTRKTSKISKVKRSDQSKREKEDKAESSDERDEEEEED